jgi:energy-coupling factor transporter transmembrane protein EcfT
VDYISHKITLDWNNKNCFPYFSMFWWIFCLVWWCFLHFRSCWPFHFPPFLSIFLCKSFCAVVSFLYLLRTFVLLISLSVFFLLLTHKGESLVELMQTWKLKL